MTLKICKALSLFFFAFSLVLCVPLAVSIYFDFIKGGLYPLSTGAFFWTLLISLILALALRQAGKKTDAPLRRRESVLLIVLIWFLASLFSALPFLFSKTLTHPIDAIFEAASGWSTTGSTVFYPKAYDPETGDETMAYLPGGTSQEKEYAFYGTIQPVKDPATGEVLLEGYDAVPRPILFWRSYLQWLGGMGIVLIFIGIFPALSLGGKFLFQIELSGGPREGLAPRLRETAGFLWKIYFGLTLLEIILLLLTNGDLSLFDAILISFSTISTGGFAPQSASIAAYHSAVTEWIVMIFMICGGINFALFYYLIKRKFYLLYDSELLFFFSWILLGSLVIFIKLGLSGAASYGFSEGAFATTLRQSAFQFVSSLTCTGFTTANYDFWPFPCQTIMLVAMYLGGMTGSTAGGIKTLRHFILFLSVKFRLQTLFRPEAIQSLKIHNKEISEKSLMNVYAFFWILIALSVFGAILLIFDNVDLETSLGLITSSLNNVGLSFRTAGPAGTCAFLSPFSKIILIFGMLLGRLEFMAILILFLPSFWKNQ